ncbi:MAG: T9SS type A sorting domain-containing protein [Marinirhabdus sp.]|nr:T9SS type A sorting domain-containing protein [Marinirhabdus sp.]
MRKIYLLAIVVFGMVASANAQFTDDIENYALGNLFTDRWTTWDGNDDGVQNAIVTNEQSLSGNASILIGPNDVQAQDAVLDFQGVADSGIWTLVFQMYVPSGNTGYFNLQGSVDPNANANLEFLSSDITLVGGTLTDANEGFTGSYPEDEWFEVKVEVDVDGQTYDISLNGSSIGSQAFNDPAITVWGGLDLFADSATNTYYIDDVQLVEGVLGADDFSASNFSIYPNPVQNRLNIQSSEIVDAVVVYDVLGKVVMSATPGVISPSIDMSALSSGAYLVNVTINGASKTVKVVK